VAAPTVKPEDIYKQTMEEYGLSESDLGLKDASDEDAERALLAHFLFKPPQRQAIGGERNGLALDRVHKQLQALLRMLSGTPLKLAYADVPSTDRVNVYLPKAMPAPEGDDANDFLIFRVMGLVQVGFARWGFLEDRAFLNDIYRDWVLRNAWHVLAARWVLRRWAEEYPGLKEDLKRVAYLDKAGKMMVNVMSVPRDGMPGVFTPLYKDLVVCLNWKEPGSEGEPAREAVRAVDAIQGDNPQPVLLAQAKRLREHFGRMRVAAPPLPWFLGVIRPEWILADLARNIAYEQEWKKGQVPLRQLLAQMAKKGIAAPREEAGPAGPAPRLSLKDRLKAKLAGPATPNNAPAYGNLRDEAQEKAKELRYGAAKWESGKPMEQVVTEGQVDKPDETGREYDEWDYKAGLYRFSAVKVMEVPSNSGAKDSYDRIVQANQKQIKEIRRRFEALRVEERWLHGQKDGSEIDLNRAIAAICDVQAGQQPDDRLYKRFVRQRQSVAILTLVDVSGSTQGNILALEQEAMVLFAEGLRTLDFPHAFYAFGNTHPAECQFLRIKSFDDTYDPEVYKRLGNLRANGATRLGAYIRHAGWILGNRPQARRILMVVSDGKPEDRNDYRGSYGVKDTAMAVSEVARVGVHVHCISLDPREEADAYLTDIFGKGKYLKLDDVDALPKRLPEVFRGLVK